MQLERPGAAVGASTSCWAQAGRSGLHPQPHIEARGRRAFSSLRLLLRLTAAARARHRGRARLGDGHRLGLCRGGRGRGRAAPPPRCASPPQLPRAPHCSAPAGVHAADAIAARASASQCASAGVRASGVAASPAGSPLPGAGLQADSSVEMGERYTAARPLASPLLSCVAPSWAGTRARRASRSAAASGRAMVSAHANCRTSVGGLHPLPAVCRQDAGVCSCQYQRTWLGGVR